MQKVDVENDWGYLTYFVGGVKLDETECGWADIQFPDGHIEKNVAFASVPRETTVADHGASHRVTYYELLFDMSFHGLNIVLSLTDVLVSNVRQ